VDLAVAILMLHHLNDIPAAIEETSRFLKPGGSLLVVDIYPHENHAFQAAMADRLPGIDPDALESVLAQAGLASSGHRKLQASGGGSDPALAPIPQLYTLVAIKNNGTSK
jgi:ArsR family transcriptional regulator